MNYELEKAILNMIFTDTELLMKYELSERDFTNSLHKKVFNYIKLFWNNLEILQGKLNQEEYDYLIGIVWMLVNYSNFEIDYKELKRLTEMRRLKEVNRQVQIALDSDSPMSNVLEKIQMYEKQEQRETNIEESLKRIIWVLDWDIIPTVYRTQYSELDHFLGWWFTPGQFIILAWRPSRGKTLLAMCIMLNLLRDNYNVAFFSLEMTIDQMTERILANNTWIAVAAMKKKATEEIARRIWDWINKLYERIPRLSIIDWIDTASEIIREIKYLVKKKWVQVVFIDYLQIMNGKWESRQYEIAKITRSLKMTAIQLGIVIVCLSQLNRQVDSRYWWDEPKLSDLRDSWSIEQDADVVLMIERDIDEWSKDLKIYIRKNRNGSCWEFMLQCLPASMQVWNPTKPF